MDYLDWFVKLKEQAQICSDQMVDELQEGKESDKPFLDLIDIFLVELDGVEDGDKARSLFTVCMLAGFSFDSRQKELIG